MLQWKTPNLFSIYEWTEGILWLRKNKHSAPLEACWLTHAAPLLCPLWLPHVIYWRLCFLTAGDLSLTPLCHFHWGPLQWGKVQGSWPKLKQTFYQLTIAFSNSWLFPRSFSFSFCWLLFTPLVLYNPRLFFFSGSNRASGILGAGMRGECCKEILRFLAPNNWVSPWFWGLKRYF